MASVERAIQNIAGGDLLQGFSELSAACSEGERLAPDVAADLKRAFWEPNLAEMEANYQRNKEFMLEYPFLLTKKFTPPRENPQLLFPLTEEIFYCLDIRKQVFSLLEISSDRETGYFFEYVDQPFCIDHEYNLYNLRFLKDNVRRSEDFAGDNHIYLCYEDADAFSLLLYYADLSELCEDSKFVFLIGEERKRYPLDFRALFRIDYSSMKPQSLRIEEMKRICAWYRRSYAGAHFGLDVLDHNPNIVMENAGNFFYGTKIKGYPLVSTNLVREAMKDISKKYTLENLVQWYNHPEIQWNFPDFPDLIQWLESSDIRCLSISELFRAYFIYSYYKNKPHMNPRITPIILWESHIWDADADNPVNPLIMEFPYKTVLSSMRNPIQHTGRIYQREGSIYIAQAFLLGHQMHPELCNNYGAVDKVSPHHLKI